MRTLIAFCFICFICSCGKLDMYEKMHTFPRHEWSSADSAVFDLEIKDSLTPHQLYLVFRHEDAYHFKNLWVQMQVTTPDSTYSIRREFILADNQKWLGSGMNDVYEHRIPFSASPAPLKAGNYHFVFKQVMREDPLENVVNVGLRAEKIRE